MTDWTTGGGEWGNSGNWSGGVPTAGSTANFSGSHTGVFNVRFFEGNDFRVGILNISLTNTGGYNFLGSLADTGTGVATLTFDNGASTAQLNFTALATTTTATFGSAGGLQMALASNLSVNVATLGSQVQFQLPISGTGRLIKTGNGTLTLLGANTFTGGVELNKGTLIINDGAALGSGILRIGGGSTSPTFIGSGTIANSMEVSAFDGIPAILGAPTGSTLTLTGSLTTFSSGTVNFGNAANTGTVEVALNAVSHGGSSLNPFIAISDGTLRMANAFSAANFLVFPGFGVFVVDSGGTLDTGGFAATVSNLDFRGGTILSGSGALNLTVNHAGGLFTVNTQTGTIQGRTGQVDRFTFNATGDANLSGVTYTTWEATDQIVINGGSANQTLTGTSRNETINGQGGNDVLIGGGGIDTISGGDGNDIIALTGANFGSTVDGGAGSDTLRVSGSLSSLGAVTGFEGINLLSGATLSLNFAQFTTGFVNTSVLSGTGTIAVNFSASATLQSLLIKGMTTTLGSSVLLDINGSTGNEVIKLPANIAANISTGGGFNRIQASDLADTVTGGSGVDKIAGNGGADILTGGGGADVFKFRAASDSGTGANADIITDFVHLTDLLNFSRIDTDPFTAGDQAFVFIDTVGFTNNGIAQIRWVDLGADLRVEADINGDGVADMHVILQGAGAQVLSSADFVL